jgi:polysaccharide transporter, PST family
MEEAHIHGGVMEPSAPRALAGRAAIYATEQAVRLGLAAVLSVVVARYLGPESFGLLSYAQSVFGLLVPLVTLGLPSILVREFSTAPEWRSILATAITYQIPVAVGVGALGFGLVGATRGWDEQAVLTALVLAPFPLLALGQTIRSYFEASQRSGVIFAAGVGGALAGAAVKVCGVVLGADVWLIAAGTTVETIVGLALLSRSVPGRHTFGALRRHASRVAGQPLIREGWPLLIAAAAVIVYMRIDIVMLGLIAGDRQAGLYSVVVRLSEVWYFVPVAALAAVRPALTRLYEAGREHDYHRYLSNFMAASAAMSYLAVLAILLGGGWLLGLLFGSAFEESSPVLRIHILAAPFVFLGVAADPWFIDRQMGREIMKRSIAGTVVNVSLNVVLIPSFGASGAAIATLVSYAFSGVLLNAVLRPTRTIFLMQLRALALIRR